MLSLLAKQFWATIWRCRHKGCRQCCWPSRQVNTFDNTKYLWHDHPLFTDPLVAQITPSSCTTQHAYRVAYLLAQQTLLLPRVFLLCHQCHFGPCCNPAHLVVGSHSDNGRDNSHHVGGGRRRSPIQLPDTRQLSYQDALQNTFNDFLASHIENGQYVLDAAGLASSSGASWTAYMGYLEEAELLGGDASRKSFHASWETKQYRNRLFARSVGCKREETRRHE